MLHVCVCVCVCVCSSQQGQLMTRAHHCSHKGGEGKGQRTQRMTRSRSQVRARTQDEGPDFWDLHVSTLVKKSLVLRPRVKKQVCGHGSWRQPCGAPSGGTGTWWILWEEVEIQCYIGTSYSLYKSLPGPLFGSSVPFYSCSAGNGSLLSLFSSGIRSPRLWLRCTSTHTHTHTHYNTLTFVSMSCTFIRCLTPGCSRSQSELERYVNTCMYMAITEHWQVWHVSSRWFRKHIFHCQCAHWQSFLNHLEATCLTCHCSLLAM